jgi:hypothetical protein
MARLSSAQLQVLKTEIDNDPKSLGYSGQNPTWKANKINEVGASGETVNRTDIGTNEILEALVWLEVNGMSTKEIQILNLFTFGDIVSVSSPNIQDIFKGLFPVATRPLTRANLIALATRSASRAEVLGLPVIYSYHIEQAAL